MLFKEKSLYLLLLWVLKFIRNFKARLKQALIINKMETVGLIASLSLADKTKEEGDIFTVDQAANCIVLNILSKTKYNNQFHYFSKRVLQSSP